MGEGRGAAAVQMRESDDSGRRRSSRVGERSGRQVGARFHRVFCSTLPCYTQGDIESACGSSISTNLVNVNMPPSYGSQDYWNQRFTSEAEPFEWLGAPHMLDPFLLDAIQNSEDTEPGLLHIGCGTSMLSQHLKTLVKDPGQIHNLDYSEIAVDLGRRREKELLRTGQSEGIPIVKDVATSLMKWDAVDMLDHKSFLRACRPGTYSIIVDKSTSDSIACSDDVNIPLPYLIDVPAEQPLDLSIREAPEPIHPLHVLAVHLALVTKPGARWIAFSYSEDRFPFVDGLYSSRPHLPGFPDTGTLWKLVDKQEIGGQGEPQAYVNAAGTIAHQPKVVHWVYVLQRTRVPLQVRGGHL